MAIAPQFTNTPNVQTSQVTVANTARDGTGTLVDIFLGGANGSRVDQLKINAIATTVAGTVRIFYHDGTNARLIKEVLVTAITASGTVAAWSADVSLSSEGYLLVENGHKLQASTEVAASFNLLATGGDY